MKKILVIIPALNEAGSIGKVVPSVLEHLPSADVLVINDGSVDTTSSIAREAGAIVLDMPFNVGIGAAMQAGYLYAWEMGYDVAIQCDGDGQHPPRHLVKLIDALEEPGIDMVIGSRFIEKTHFKSSASRKTGIVMLSRYISLLIREKVTDTTSGFRAVSRKVIRLFAHDYPHDYPEPEVLVMLHKAGLHFKEISVSMRHRRTGTSSINLFRGIYYMIKVMLALTVDLFKEVPRVPEVPPPRPTRGRRPTQSPEHVNV